MFDDHEVSDDESSAWFSEDEEESFGQGDDATAYGGNDTADSWDRDSKYGDASADAADLFAGEYDDGGAPDVANAMGPKDEFPWPPPKTMVGFRAGFRGPETGSLT